MYISRNIVRVRWQNACTGVNPGFVSLRFTQFKGVPLKKRIQNYKYRIRYESEYIFRMRK